MAELEGQSLGRYKIQQLMGRGGMADVYLAYDPRFEREVAIKIFKREDEDLLRRFIREAQLMASLSNPHLMPVYDSGTGLLDGINVYYIVMPYMDGGTLRSLVRRSPLSLKAACRYVSDIADALDYIHEKGIIHRDIKSSNILLDADGRCYLADFGIARSSTESTQLTSTGNVLGTVDYMAPELFETDGKADERSDYYSLGVLLYEMVTGRLPFVAENPIAVVTMHVNRLPPSPSQYIPDLPPAVEQVMMRGLEKKPELRYGSATDLAQSFCRAISVPSTLSKQMSAVSWADSSTVSAPMPAYNIPGQKRTTPAVTRNLPAYSTQNYPVMTGQYSAPPYAPGNTPQQLHKVQQADRNQGRILVFLTVLALLAVLAPVTYILYRDTHIPNTTSNITTPNPNTQATTAAQMAATASQQALVNASATALTQQQKDASATAAANASATALAKASATAAANASATALANASATAAANASATAGVILTAVAGTPVYQDSLTNSTNTQTQAAQWDQTDNCAFQDDGYHVIADALTQFRGCHEVGKVFTNFAAQVEVSIKKGDTGGLFFRLNTTQLGIYKGYLFEIDNKGNYRVSSSDSFNVGAENSLQNWTASSALKSGAAQNNLQVIAKGNTLSFYANNTFLVSLSDQAYSSGTLGFVATTKGDSADVVYTNLDVYNT